MSQIWPPVVDSVRLAGELQALASYSDDPEPPPAVTRVVFGGADVKARQFLRELFVEAGLSVRIDPIGNTFARWEGKDLNAAAVATGSHIDAIPHAGMYDGTVGVLGGLEAIRALQRSGFRPKKSIELILFTSEEPTRFGIGCLGSRAISGSLTAEKIDVLRDENDVGVEVASRDIGCDGNLDDVRLTMGAYAAFVELHIEQGPDLDASGIPIGIVTAIAAPATVQVSVTGEGGHAGAVLMDRRRDALVAAAEIIVAIESLAKTSTSPDLVATVGWLQVHPGAVNSIASRVRLKLDIRDIDGPNRDETLVAIREAAQSIAASRKVQLEWEIVNADPPANAAPEIASAIEHAADQLRMRWQPMISRAYHDTLFMARLAPAGMIFIPCRNGYSHRPDEYSSTEDIAAGVQVLSLVLAELAG